MLTEELRGWIGREARYTAPEELGRAAIRYFALAVGDDNPRYPEEAPPTLVVETNQYMHRPPGEDGYIGHTWDLPVPPGARLIRGGHAYTFSQPVRPSDVLSVTWRVADIAEKTSRAGTAMIVVTSEASFANQHGDALATNRETTIHQYVTGAPEAPATPSGPPPPLEGDPLPALERTLGPAQLVAYAGATWDWYRTHYDAQAAAAAKLPAPIVDGQMLGALLAEHAQDWAGPGARVTALAFRFAAMVFAGDTVRVEGRIADADDRCVTLEQRILVGDRVAVSPARTTLERARS